MPEVKRFTLFCDELGASIRLHHDVLDERPVVLSMIRATKPNQMKQLIVDSEMGDPLKCRFCTGLNGKRYNLTGEPEMRYLYSGKVAYFDNMAPYFSLKHLLLFLDCEDKEKMKTRLHTPQLRTIRPMDLYYLLKGCVDIGKTFEPNELHTNDMPRMVIGFNIGHLAGQSIYHLHAQLGIDVRRLPTIVAPETLQLYLKEISQAQLMIRPRDFASNGNYPFILYVPWTPRGQYALDLMFPGVYSPHQLSDEQIKTFALLGHRILQAYRRKFRIQQVNMIISGSPYERKSHPVRIRFVPKVNMAAFYEVEGCDVVDTPPENIMSEFKGFITNWNDFDQSVASYNSEQEWDEEMAKSELLLLDTVEAIEEELRGLNKIIGI